MKTKLKYILPAILTPLLIAGFIYAQGLWFPDSNDNLTPVDETWGIALPALTNCDTIDTNASGTFACGTDETGVGTNWIISDSTMYATDTISYVGIGTTTPGYTLTVDGQIFTTGTLTAKIHQVTPEGSQNVTLATTTINAHNYSFYELIPDADYILAATPTIPVGADGQLLYLHNNSSFTLTFQDESDLPDSNIRLGSADATLRPNSLMSLLYDAGETIWVVMSNPNSSVGGANADVLEVRNVSGGPIAAGKAVYITGYNVGLGRPTIDLADADDNAKMPAIGITATAISNGTNGQVITSGTAVGLIDTSGASVNDGVWISTTAGAVVFTRPIIDNIQRIGTVSRSNANGTIIVTGAGRINDVPKIFEMTALTVGTTTLTSGIFEVASSTSFLFIGANGNVGVASTTPGELFSVGNFFGVDSSGNVIGTWQGTAIADAYIASSTEYLVDSDTQLNEEQVQDFAFTNSLTGTETLITVDYIDGSGNINFIVNNDLSQYSNATSGFLTSVAWGDLTGNASDVITAGTLIDWSNSTLNVAVAYSNLGGYPADVITAGDLLSWSASTTLNATVTASDVGLGNVENTALSSWGGSTNILTVGTIATGTWEGTIIADSYIANDITLTNITQISTRNLSDMTDNISNATTGSNVASATALASNPTDCGANNYAYQIDASGNLTCSTIDISLSTNLGGVHPIVMSGDDVTLSTASSSLWMTAYTFSQTTVPETSGGTGIISYNLGDLLVADGANSLTVLATGTNDKVLTMVAGVPAWATAAVGNGVGGAFATSTDAGNIIYPQDSLFDFILGTSTGASATSTATFYFDVSEGNLFLGSGGAGDSVIDLYADGAHKWTFGMDDSDTDNFKISTAADFSSGNYLIINQSSGLVTVNDLTCTDCIDISGETNLAVSGTLLNLTGDTLKVNEGTLTSGKACIYTSGTGIVCDTTLTTGDVTAASNITDHRIVRGDGGAKGIQESLLTIDDNGNLTGVVDLTISGGFTSATATFSGVISASNLSGTNTGDDDVPEVGDFDALVGGRSLTYDTGTNQMNADAELYTGSFTFAFINATTTKNGQHQHSLPVAITITDIACYTNTNTIDIQLDERASTTPNSAGTDIMNAVLVCDTDQQSTTTFANAGISAYAKINFDVDAIGADEIGGGVTVYYTIDD